MSEEKNKVNVKNDGEACMRSPVWRQSLPRTFFNACVGFFAAVRTQRNMRLHLLSVIVVVAAGIYLGISAGEWMAIAVSCAMVTSAEVMNTAVETVVDLVSPQYNILAKQAKDYAACAVLIASAGALVVGGVVFIPKIVRLF